MSFEIAEFFVKLGVKGENDAKRALKGVDKDLGDLSTSALAAKAGILAVVYGIERMTAASAREGAELKNFWAATGLDPISLQKVQYAMGLVNVGAEEVTATLKTLQTNSSNIALGQGVPKFWTTFANAVKLDTSKMRDSFYMLQKFQEFAKSGVSPDILRNISNALGISDNVLAGLKRSSVDWQKLTGVGFSQKQIDSLDHINAEWFKLWNTLKLFSGGLVAEKGGSAVVTLEKSLMGGIGTIRALRKEFSAFQKQLPEVATAVEVFAAALALYFAPITATVAGLIFIMSKWEGNKGKVIPKPGEPGFYEAMGIPKPTPNLFAPPMGPSLDLKNNPAQGAQTTVNSEVNIYADPDNPREHADIVQRHVERAFYQSPALTQGR